jgi:hypothetical protein
VKEDDNYTKSTIVAVSILCLMAQSEAVAARSPEGGYAGAIFFPL